MFRCTLNPDDFFFFFQLYLIRLGTHQGFFWFFSPFNLSFYDCIREDTEIFIFGSTDFYRLLFGGMLDHDQ